MMQLEDVVVSGVTEFVRIYIILEYFKIFSNVHSLRRNIISCVITYIITLLSYLVFHNVLVNLIVTVAGIIFLSGCFSVKFQNKILLSIMLYKIMFITKFRRIYYNFFTEKWQRLQGTFVKDLTNFVNYL